MRSELFKEPGYEGIASRLPMFANTCQLLHILCGMPSLLPRILPHCQYFFRLGYRVIDRSRYYTLSIILGTVALSYGSVPMYKMVISAVS